MAGRPGYLDPSALVTEEEAKARRKELAHLVVRGLNRKELAAHFGVHKDTITTWTQRPDVRALIRSIAQARLDRVIHRIDADLERRVEKVADMELEDVVKLRKELTPHRIEVSEKAEETDAVVEMMAELFQEVEDDARAAATDAPSPSRG
jgi:hypothetical protein